MYLEISGNTQERSTGLTPLERAFNFKNFWQDRSPRSQDPRKYDETIVFRIQNLIFLRIGDRYSLGGSRGRGAVFNT